MKLKLLIFLMMFCGGVVHAQERYKVTTSSGENILVNTPKENDELLKKKTNFYDPKSDENLNWVVSCQKDKITDIKECNLAKQKLIVNLKNNKYSIVVAGNRYPNTKSFIRVDDKKSISSMNGIFSNTGNILNQLKNGNKVVIRYYEWPSSLSIDKEIDLSGFNEKFEEMNLKYKSL